MQGLRSSSAFWQAATLAVPVGSAVAVLLFGVAAGAADARYPTEDLSKHWVFAVVAIVMAVAAGLLAWRRTSRTLGAAAGVLAADLLVVFVWLAT